MNIAGWVQEVRRLLRAIYPNRALHYHTSPVGLEYHPERTSDGVSKLKQPTPGHWTASCGAVRREAATAEEAAAALVADLEGQIAERIASMRAEVARLEAAQASKLRIVRAEKPS
jgi:hypothetical protein